MITDFAGANLAIADFWADVRDEIAADLQAELAAIIALPVPPEKAALFAELIYARRAGFKPAALAAAAEVCLFAAGHGFYGLATDGRGLAISRVLRGVKRARAPQPLARFRQDDPGAALLAATTP